jgi:hypothetical protein
MNDEAQIAGPFMLMLVIVFEGEGGDFPLGPKIVFALFKRLV